MHELALCRAVVATVDRHAAGRPVVRVRLRVGRLRQVVPEALDLAWHASTTGTALAGAALEVETVPAEVRCADCAACTVLEWPVPVCGACGSHGVEVVAGEELLVTSIDLADPATLTPSPEES